MSKSLETKSYMVGSNPSYQTSSKSMLSTMKLGYVDTEDPPATPKPESFVEKPLLKTTFKTGFEHNDTPVILQPIIELKLKHEDSVIDSVTTGFEEYKSCLKPTFTIIESDQKHEDSVIDSVDTGFEPIGTSVISQPIVEFKQSCQKHEDSVIDSVDTGFGECKTIENSCPKPTFKSHLYKENYLSEFKTETEKALARNHLGVYGKSETVAIIKQEIGSLQSFIKKEEVEKMIADLDFVNSTLKAFADYQIPENLFKL